MRPLSNLRTLVVGALAFIGAAVAAFYLAMWLAPPRTAGGHKTMAIGHAMIALMAGGIAAIAAMIVDRARQHSARDAWMEAALREGTGPEAPRSPES
jgi:hypothetical protein